MTVAKNLVNDDSSSLISTMIVPNIPYSTLFPPSPTNPRLFITVEVVVVVVVVVLVVVVAVVVVLVVVVVVVLTRVRSVTEGEKSTHTGD